MTNLVSEDPATGAPLGAAPVTTPAQYETAIAAAEQAFMRWRELPAPRRGEIVRQIGEAFRRDKAALGRLVTQETGKILSEGLGEVQEVIDICDFAVGLSRQLYGLSMHSERAQHRMYEQWHPLGPVAVITAFNFPVAVWAWNAMIAAVCGDSVVWKPSPKASQVADVAQGMARAVLSSHGFGDVFQVMHGGAEIGMAM